MLIFSVLEYDAQLGIATLEWNGDTVSVDTSNLLTRSTHNEEQVESGLRIRIGEMVNVIGYLTPLPLSSHEKQNQENQNQETGNVRQRNGRRQESKVVVKAVMWWSAGRMSNQMREEWERVVTARLALPKQQQQQQLYPP